MTGRAHPSPAHRDAAAAGRHALGQQPDIALGHRPAHVAAAVVLLVAAAVSAFYGLITREPAQPAARSPEVVLGWAPASQPASGWRTVLAAGTEAPSETATSRTKHAPLRIDLNTATAAQLELLPGIGPSKARTIVEDRDRHGPFRSVEDLDRVRGIGSKTVERLREHVTVSDEPLFHAEGRLAVTGGRAPTFTTTDRHEDDRSER